MGWELKRDDIRVERPSSERAIIEFDTQEVRTKDIDTRFAGIPPRPQYRYGLRKATIRIELKESMLPTTGHANLDELVVAVIAFILCCFALAALVAFVAATLFAGPITWPMLLEMIELFCGACLIVLGGVEIARALEGFASNKESKSGWITGIPIPGIDHLSV